MTGTVCVISFEDRETVSRTQLPASCLPGACFFFLNLFIFYTIVVFWEGNHQHQLLLSQDAFRGVTSDKQAIIRNSLLLDHQAVRKLSSILQLPAASSESTWMPLAALWLALALIVSADTLSWSLLPSLTLTAKLVQSGLGYLCGTHHSDLICFLTPLSLKMLPCPE